MSYPKCALTVDTKQLLYVLDFTRVRITFLVLFALFLTNLCT